MLLNHHLSILSYIIITLPTAENYSGHWSTFIKSIAIHGHTLIVQLPNNTIYYM